MIEEIFYDNQGRIKIYVVKKIKPYKMEALTIKTFKTSKISTVEVSEKRSQEFKYKKKIAYDGAEVPPEIVKCGF